MTRRAASRTRALALGAAFGVACGLVAAPSGAAAQGFFQDLFGPSRPAAPQTRAAPPARRQDRQAAERQKKKKETQKAKQEAKPAAPQGPAGEAPPPPYDGQMMRLAEILGALSFLRDLCGDNDGGQWRAQMSTLLDAEAPAGSGARRQRLTASFNRGFRDYEITYRACTPNARTAITRYLDESAKIARDIAYRYGNP